MSERTPTPILETAANARGHSSALVHELMEMTSSINTMLDLLTTCPGPKGDELSWKVWEDHKTRTLKRLKGQADWNGGEK